MAEWHKKVYRLKIKRQDFEINSWVILQEQVIKRDKGKCKACGATGLLTAHHIIPRDSGGKDTLKNLEALCNKCHNKIECGEDIFAVEKHEKGKDWHEWVYGGKRMPSY